MTYSNTTGILAIVTLVGTDIFLSYWKHCSAKVARWLDGFGPGLERKKQITYAVMEGRGAASQRFQSKCFGTCRIETML